MTRRNGYALLSAIIALIVAVSAAIYVGFASDDSSATSKNVTAQEGAPRNPAAPASTGIWVGAWSASPVGAEPGTELEGMAGRSVRNVVHTSVGGTSARITLSNLYGRSALTITHASIAVAAGTGTAAAIADTMRRLTFGGNTTVVIPPGQQVLSDAVRLAIPADTDVLVTTYSPTRSGPVTYHPHARQTSYVAEGDVTEDATGVAYTGQVEYWRYLTALDVLSNESDGTVVVFGDSLTDGITSTENANRRWTDVLSRRLRAAVASGQDVPRYSVANQGISGNQILASGAGRPANNEAGISRFHRDVLSRTNVKVVVIDLGVNDILRNPNLADPNRILDGLRTLVRQAHARGLKVIGATLMPFQGHRGYTEAREGVRQQINAEIRAGRVFDAVVDFDKAVRDPYNPRTFHPDYDSGDHLHPSDKGYERMAEAFNLQDLKGAAPAEL
ncbi:SGNH/GDSL hydrolase family protein [Streptomyces sp. ISL-22]|uniref:SGNH/GDSL hydrolase family protein n=1 Tax=unclassified Streptomyces TaxID=2593676 RepID=UPI001BEC6706|nr:MULTISPECIES: SGNH/GDSL hydrolase family protein [unclassified Streptomyces]MBT2423277.1 SGNH/GDSL hydrolase family protein [Streptomyces sp. ISL-24]MBT2431663.1 SGNH/GDSL hydrolase family protein [Streptomyces sp. ISL-22]